MADQPSFGSVAVAVAPAQRTIARALETAVTMDGAP
jgi:hypothetical protein